MVTEHARNIVALLGRLSGPQSLVMLFAKMGDRIMLPLTHMNASIRSKVNIVAR